MLHHIPSDALFPDAAGRPLGLTDARPAAAGATGDIDKDPLKRGLGCNEGSLQSSGVSPDSGLWVGCVWRQWIIGPLSDQCNRSSLFEFQFVELSPRGSSS